MEKNGKTWLWTVIFGGNEIFVTYNCIKVKNVEMIAIGALTKQSLLKGRSIISFGRLDKLFGTVWYCCRLLIDFRNLKL